MIHKHGSTILLSMGTRPEIIKMAPVYLELRKRGARPLLLHTGQHSDMATELYNLFGIVPDYHIDLKRDANSKALDLAELSSALLLECSKVLTRANPSIVLVHGDTSSALMMTLAAYYHKCKIAHIEAGLRSFDEHHPFPEEKNRILIGQMAHWHFAPTLRAKNNLRSEGIAGNTIFVVGNTIVQAAKLGAELLEAQRKKKASSVPDLVDKLSKKSKGMRMVLVTSHRRENHEEGLRSIAKSMLELLRTQKDTLVVWPVHPNPKVKKIVEEEIGQLQGEIAERLYLTPPLSYPVLLWILKHSWVVLTDSGGIQEEAVSLNTPVLVLRKTTERPEVIEIGAGALVGTNSDRILSAIDTLKKNPPQYEAMRNVINPFGDEHVANAICNILLGTKSLGVVSIAKVHVGARSNSFNTKNLPFIQEVPHA